MQSCRLSPRHLQKLQQQQQTRRTVVVASRNGTASSPAVKFSLAMGDSPDASSSSLSSQAIAEELVPWGNSSKKVLEPRRPVTMTTCCHAERTATGDSQSHQLQQHREQQQSLLTRSQLTLKVYCENSLASFRPPPRRTMSFPPPPLCASRAMPILVQPIIPLESIDHKSDQLDGNNSPKLFAEIAAEEEAGSPLPPRIGVAERRARRRVRFADALGFELTSVRVVACDPEEPPVIPSHVLAALRRQLSLLPVDGGIDDYTAWCRDEESAAGVASALSPLSQPNVSSYSTCWKPTFSTQPCEAAISKRLDDQLIALESIRLETMALEASVRVKNLGPVKKVWLRLTDSAWQTHTDFQLHFVEQLSDGDADRFKLTTCLPVTAFSAHRLEFALGFHVEGQAGEFWDNNCGRNFCFYRLSQLHRASCACY